MSLGESPSSPEFGIEAIRRAAERIAPYVANTPVLSSKVLDAEAGTHVLAKAEALQVTGSFKFRGALNKVLASGPGVRTAGIVGYSAGNHAAAIAAVGRIVGCRAVVVIPTTAPAAKVQNCRSWGAEVVFYDPATQDRAEVAESILAEGNMEFIPPFDDYDIMAGAGTVGLELASELDAAGVTPDAVVVGCSGGGLASGVLTAMEHHFPGIEKYIVEPAGYNKMARSLAAGEVCTNPAPGATVMDGISGPVVGDRCLSVLGRLGVTPLSVDDDEALEAVAAAFRYLRVVVEPAGAASLAAVMSRQLHRSRTYANVALVLSGGNVDPALYGGTISGSGRPFRGALGR
ncbi:threonine/serine dehydratase [Nocardioides sp. NPDC087217]|uniref:threonine ammonia-lyase n=1 Tax=Nocardioides sp. NPDC087217 TaxID=3364335 RepID=UPI0038224FFE